MTDRFRKTYLPFEISFEKPKKVSKAELARLAKEAGEKYFYADCRKHGRGVKHLVSDTKCSLCIAERGKKYYKKNREVISERKKQYRQENREAILEYRRNYCQENRGHRSEYAKWYYQENKERLRQYRQENRKAILEYAKRYYQRNRKVLSERNKKYYQENRKVLSEYRKQYNKQYRQDNAAYFLARGVLSRLGSDKQEAFSGITKDEAEALCEYSQGEFILHIESTFKDGMTWENRSEWHIDHILPVAWFKEQGITDIKVINALTNLRAEWASDNISKGKKFLEETLTEEEFFDMLCQINDK